MESELLKLNRAVIQGTANGKILWQPRIRCWFDDKEFRNEPWPQPYTGLSQEDVYRRLGCSNRLYSFNDTFTPHYTTDDIRVEKRWLDKFREETVIHTPVGTINTVIRYNSSNPGKYKEKWFLEEEEDFRVGIYLEQHTEYSFHQELYDTLYAQQADLGLPTIFIERVSIQRLFYDMCGVENTVYALMDYPETVEEYFRVLSDKREKMLHLLGKTPFEWINFGDNIHCKLLSPELFQKYVLPEYQRDNAILHSYGKFTDCHWDGDVKDLLPFVRQTGFDGIEAITPFPQGDVSLQEVKAALGDQMFLIDGVASLLFAPEYTEEQLLEQVQEAISLFAPKLILGISDEMPSNGLIERVKLVQDFVDKYNAAIEVPAAKTGNAGV